MTTTVVANAMQSMQRQYRVEQFYYREAELLDSYDLDEWFELFTDDIRYWVPSRVNRMRQDAESTLSTHREFSLLDDSKVTLGWRVRQQQLNTHWAENPRSRVRHLITNIRAAAPDETGRIAARSNFLCYRNRMQDEVDFWVGERQDLLVEIDGDLRVDSRTVYLDQSLILSKNLNIFF